MKQAPASTWKHFSDFMAGFAAARELHSRAGKNGSFVECVCLGASITDAMLRIGLILQYQINEKSRDIPLELVLQEPNDDPISEREIYRRAASASVINATTLAQLQALYTKRNSVMHRYVISRITTADVLEIASQYEKVIEELSKRIYKLEETQIELKVGITVEGPDIEGKEGKQFIESFADEKHTPELARLLRGS